MKAMNAVVGYLPDAVAKAITSKGGYKDPLEVKMEPGNNEMHVKISPKDIAGVLVGASNKGETSVQVLLKENATIEAVARGSITDFLKPIRDLSFIKVRPPVNMIFVDPQFIDKLVDFNR
jgi:hypothetical protein